MSNPVERADCSTIKWAGARSSRYGIDPFPNPEEWTKAISTIANNFPNATPVAVWLVGEIHFDGINSGMEMYFPNPGGNYDPRIKFSDEDKNESYLNFFDSNGIKVFLQVEPGFADMNDLIDATFKQYGNHPCVIGFGVDVEWYQSQRNGDESTPPVTDELAQAWEEKVKSYNGSYRLFLKHYHKPSWPEFKLPKNYRGDIIFVNDSQEHPGYQDFLDEMKEFADFFYPSPVMYQFGYKIDKSWWQELPAPIPQTMGQGLSNQAKVGQDVGIVWVDFTLKCIVPI
jgi:hypothetical protein